MNASFANPIKLSGITTWIYYGGGNDSAPTQALIRNNNEIVVECKWKNDYYTAPLLSNDGIKFDAEFEKTGNEKTKVIVSGKLWSNKTGYMIFGTWREAADEMYWIVELGKLYENKS